MTEMFNQFGVQFSPLMAQMDEDQWNELFDNLDEKNADYAEKYIEPTQEEVRENTREKVEDIFEDFLGELSDDQLQLIESWSQNYRQMFPGVIASRQNWRSQLETLSKADLANEQKVLEINRLFQNRKQYWPLTLKKDFEFNQNLMVELIYEMTLIMDASQKQKVAEKANQYSADFKYLSKPN